MLENFVILHSSGECLFLKHYGGDTINLNLVMGISSSLSTLLAVTKKRSAAKAGGGGGGASDSKDSKSAAGGGDSKLTDSDPASGSGSGSGGSALCTITVSGLQFVYVESGPLTLVAQGTDWSSTAGGAAYLGQYVRAIEEVLLYYVGPFLAEPNHLSAVKGVMDMVDKLLLRMVADVSILVRGVRWVFLDDDKREQSDRVLASVTEQNANIFGSAIILGQSVLHARLPPTDARMVMWQLLCRPLGIAKVRCVPVYCANSGGTAFSSASGGSGGAGGSGGVWKQLVLVRLRHGMVLALLCTLRTVYSSLTGVIDALDEALTDNGTAAIGTTASSGSGGNASGLPMPVEEPPVLLRHYTGHDTIAFVYVHLATHVCVAPPPRPGPASEQQLTTQAFAAFYSKIVALAASGQACEVTLHERGYRFSASFTDSYNLFVLYSERVSIQQIDELNREIVKNVSRHLRPLSDLVVFTPPAPTTAPPPTTITTTAPITTTATTAPAPAPSAGGGSASQSLLTPKVNGAIAITPSAAAKK